jgi:hypothetical protein
MFQLFIALLFSSATPCLSASPTVPHLLGPDLFNTSSAASISLWRHIEEQTTVVRPMGSPALARIQDDIVAYFASLNEQRAAAGLGGPRWVVREQRTTFETVSGRRDCRNLMAFWTDEEVDETNVWWTRTKPSARAEQGKGVTVLAAHVDSKYYEDMDFYGAHDAGASVAILLHLAAAMASWPAATNPIVLVFLDGEEAIVRWTGTDSLYGSRALAAAWGGEPPPSQVVGGAWTEETPASSVLPEIARFVLLDLLGDADLHLVPTFPNTAPDFARLTAAESLFLPLVPTGEPTPIFDSDHFLDGRRLIDDHVPFLQRGVPIVHLMPHPFPATWHTERDTFAELDGAASRLAAREALDGEALTADLGRFTLERVAACLEVALLEWAGIASVDDVLAASAARHDEL